MTLGGKLFWSAVTVGGLCSASWSFGYASITDLRLFLIYLTLASASACWRVKIPNVAPVVSLHFLFVLLSLSQLSLSETMIIALVGTSLQYVLFTKQMDPPEFLFELGISALATTGTFLFHASLFGAGLPTVNQLGSPLAQLGSPLAQVGSPLALAASATILFLLTTLPGCLAIQLARRGSALERWRENCLPAFPHYLAGGGAAGLFSSIHTSQVWEVGLLVIPAVYWIYVSHRQHVTDLDEDRRQIRELANLNYRTIEALSLTMESHDPRPTGHLRRVSIYVAEIGRYLGLPEPQQQALQIAAMLHDIGKLAVPEHILNKTGELTNAERESLHSHPVAGAEILEEVRFPYPVAPIVRAHREKWDGTGYPDRLEGEEIPLGARILAVVDSLDALLSSRQRGAAADLGQAVDCIRAESGKSFDPDVVQVLLLHYRELEQKVAQARQQGLESRSILGPHLGPHLGPPLDTPRDHDPERPSGATVPSFFHRIAAARKEEQNLFQLIRELGNSLSLDETLALCAHRIQAMCPYDAIVISIRREQKMAMAYSAGLDFLNLGIVRTALAGDLSERVAATKQAIVNGDPAEELAPLGAIAGNDLLSALVAPLEGLDGVVGVVALLSRTPNAYTTDHLRVLNSVSTKAALSVENAIKFSRAESSASTDALTGLPNARSLFVRLDGELARARREDNTVAVLVCDLDQFKQVNDRLGHLEGNRVLKLVADSLASQCREYDFIARMGGDEFVAILSGYPPGLLDAKIQQFQLAVDVACRQAPDAVSIGLSVGEAVYPEDGEDAESLLAAADRNMYRMKLVRKHPLSVTASLNSQSLKTLP